MSRRTAAWLAWSLVVVFVGLHVVATWLYLAGRGDPGELFSVVTLGYAVVGALIASRHPDNAVGWVLIALALAFGLQTFGEVYVGGRDNPGYLAVAWFAGWSWYVWVILALGVLPLVFPDGRLLSRRWRPALWLVGLALALSIVGAAFRPGNLDLESPVTNPLGASGFAADLVAVSASLGEVGIAAVAVLAAVSLVVRLRRSRGIERQQLKWFVSAGLAGLAGMAVAIVAVTFPGGWREPLGAVGWFTFLAAVVLGLPVAVGLAILRHRLYDIDVVIKRTLVYGPLTAALVAAYLLLVLVLQPILNPVARKSDLAVAASTLAVAALFRPLRARIQHLVDRRFYRERYDAARTLEAFAGRLRDELDLEVLGADLRHVVRDTVHPTHVSLWLRGAR